MILKTEAIVLKSFAFRETSRIATFFTKDYGKVKGVLKGIRSNPRKFGSYLDKFSVNDIVYYQYRRSRRLPAQHGRSIRAGIDRCHHARGRARPQDLSAAARLSGRAGVHPRYRQTGPRLSGEDPAPLGVPAAHRRVREVPEESGREGVFQSSLRRAGVCPVSVYGKRSDAHFQRHDRLDLAYRAESLGKKSAAGPDQDGPERIEIHPQQIPGVSSREKNQNRGVFVSRPASGNTLTLPAV